MAGDWIKIENVTPDKPEVFQMAESLGIDPDAVTGKLLRIWIWADQQTEDGNARGVTRLLLDRITGVSGFADALLSVGWLNETDEGLSFTNFDRHNGKTAKQRALTNRRVAESRKKKRSSNADGNAQSNADTVTESVTREEKRRGTTTSSPARDDRPRFRMDLDWQPSAQMAARLKISGVPPDILTNESLGEFKSYWLTRDDELTHDQWEHKLVQCLMNLHRRVSHENRGEHRNSRDAVRAAIDSGDKSWAAGL